MWFVWWRKPQKTKRERLEKEKKQVSSKGVVQRTNPEARRKEREKITRQMTYWEGCDDTGEWENFLWVRDLLVLGDLMWFWLVLAWGWEFSLSSILELGELQIEYYSIWWIKLRNHYSSTLKITGMQHNHIIPQILYICLGRISWWGLFFILKTL